MADAQVAARARDLEAIRLWVNGHDLTTALHLECEVIEPGRSVWRMDPPDGWRNPNGSVAGAAFLGAVDYAAGMAALSVTTEDDYVSTVDLGLHFLRPAMAAPLRITSTVLRAGRRLVSMENEVTDADGVVVATGIGCFSIAAGRGRTYPIGPAEDG